ncbi:MAG: hypothetical protein WC099_03060 [Candidatus Paceibacterota bacterium]
MLVPEYLKTLQDRASKSHIYRKYQSTGIEIAELLDDREHIALYIKLAKTKNEEFLIQIAKDIATRNNVKNKGAYFMKMIKEKK